MTPTCKERHVCYEGISRLEYLDLPEECQIHKNLCYLGHAECQVATCSLLLPLCAALALSPYAVADDGENHWSGTEQGGKGQGLSSC